MMRILCLAIVLASMGCGGVSITPNPDPIPVSGKVTVGGKPVTDVKINFQATEIGLPAVADVKDGAFTANIVPGKYTYYFTEGKKPASFKSIPDAYRIGSLDRQKEITDGSALELALD